MKCDIRSVNDKLRKLRQKKRLFKEPLKKARQVLFKLSMNAFKESGIKQSLIKTDGKNTGIICKIYDVSLGVYVRLAGVYRTLRIGKKYLPMQFFTTGTIVRHTKKGYNRGFIKGFDFLQGVQEKAEQPITEIFKQFDLERV